MIKFFIKYMIGLVCRQMFDRLQSWSLKVVVMWNWILKVIARSKSMAMAIVVVGSDYLLNTNGSRWSIYHGG